MLRLDGIAVTLGGFALEADLTVPEGTRVAVVGPSGAGKTTLLNIVAGFVAPDCGRVLWRGREITGLAPGERPLSVIFQEGNLFPHLSVEQNVGLGIRPSLRLSGDERQSVAAALERVGLGGVEPARRPAGLSGGQRSRVALARMLLRGRPLVLLDEPFAALGPGLKDEMLDLVADLTRAEGITLLLVTHDPQDAARIAEQTIVVAGGVASPPRDTAALFADPPAELRDYLGARHR